jgi:dynein heavy chain 2
VRCESNPALYTRCTILWFGEWARESMDVVPKMLLRGSDLMEEDHDAKRYSEAIIDIQLSASQSLPGGATPGEFVAFIQNWQAMHARNVGRIKQELGHLEGGLGKLEDAAETVDVLKVDAGKSQKELAIAQKAADVAMDQITQALEQATERRKEVEDLRVKADAASAETKTRKADIEQELASINPILESAKQAVGLIKSDNLNEIRSLKMPPEPIHDVLSAVLMLLGINDTSWLSMKKFLGNRGVKDEILGFDAHRITTDIRRSTSKLLKEKASSFDHANIYRVSVAAAPLAAWVKANIRYSLVLDKIQPLENDLQEAVRTLEASQERLEQCESELQVSRAVRESRERAAGATRCTPSLHTIAAHSLHTIAAHSLHTIAAHSLHTIAAHSLHTIAAHSLRTRCTLAARAPHAHRTLAAGHRQQGVGHEG